MDCGAVQIVFKIDFTVAEDFIWSYLPIELRFLKDLLIQYEYSNFSIAS